MLAPVLALLLTAVPATQAFAPKHRPYDVERYSLKLRLNEGGTFDSAVSVTLTPAANLSVVELDAYGLTIKGVALEDGRALPYAQRDEPAQRTGWLRVTPSSPFPRGRKVTLVITFSGRAGSENAGFFMAKDAEDPAALPGYFTQFEPTAARRFFPCNDEPYDKALTEVEAEVDARYQVLSNGAKVKDEEFADGARKLRRVKWVQDKPHSTYLVALAVGRFEPVPVGATVPATIWVAPGKGALTAYAKEQTKAALQSEADYVGMPYPWAKYDQVAVPGFLFGGMENTSLVLARDNRLALEEPGMVTEAPGQGGLVAHELAHQWFGDLVTCQWWDDTWLNEGFATYLAWVAQDAFYKNDLVKVGRTARTVSSYFRDEDGPRAHPLVGRNAPTPDDVFDSTSYTKGANVLRMLEQLVGTEPLRKGLKAYLETYAYKNATSAQFFAAIGKATGQEKDVLAFQKAWTEKRGYPVLSPKAQWTGQGVKLTVAQKPNHPDTQGPFLFKLTVVLARSTAPAYRKEVVLRMDRPLVEQEVAVPAAPEWVNWNQGGSALARVEDGAVSEQEWMLASRQDVDPVWRLMANLALLRPLLDPAAPEAVQPSPRALGTVAAALANDYSPYVRQEVLRRLATAPRRRLPLELAPVVVSLAQQPMMIAPDELGIALVRKAAFEALGRFDYPRGEVLLVDALGRRDAPLDLYEATAVGTARLGTPEAMQALQAARETQRARGPKYVKAVAAAYGAAETPEAFSMLGKVLETYAGNNEVAGRILQGLHDNTARRSPEGVRFVRDFVLGNKTFGDDVKGRMLRLLDEVRTPEAKQALADMAQKSDSERLRASAQQVLDRNFGPGAKAR